MIALLWMTHTWAPELEAQFDALCRMDARTPPDVWLLLDSRTAGSDAIAARFKRCHRFDEASLFQLPYPRLEGCGLLQHPQFPVLDFYRRHRDYSYYWVVEYDVRYTGDWAALLDSFSRCDADLITAHIRRYREEPRWPWWWTLSHPTKMLERDALLRSFNVCYRISNQALDSIDRAQMDGWRGYPEVSFPTLLDHAGFSLLDMGGQGSFTPQDRRNTVYTSFAPSSGFLSPFGSLRCRPSRVLPGKARNLLYHPVKPALLIEPFQLRMGMIARWAWDSLLDVARR